MNKNYSVLMSVYRREKPEYLRASLKSMIEQTLPPNELVLVCDGPLTDGLESVLKEFGGKIKTVRLKENIGLGGALSEGLRSCSNEWIARMDSDDLAAVNRCEIQMKYIDGHPNVDVLSGTIAEFVGEALDTTDARKTVKTYKRVPMEYEQVKKEIRYRNPINHPCVMFRKSKVMEVGSYCPCSMFEDYYLWVRMIVNDCVVENIGETLVYMRVNDMHKRRGGMSYARAVIQFQNKLFSLKVISFPQYLFNVFFRVGMCVLPVSLRRLVYDAKLRSSD